MTAVALAIFTSAFGVAIWAMAITVLPRIDRIVDALAGRPAASFHPLQGLLRAERRIAVRRWAAVDQRQPARATRAVA